MQNKTHRFSHNAMATIYEVIINHPDEGHARQASLDAFNVLDQIENDISRFRNNSDITTLNIAPAGLPIRISIHTFNCLRECARLYKDTFGTFDITIGTLLNCWLDKDKKLKNPSVLEIHAAMAKTGMDKLLFVDNEPAVTLSVTPMTFDLGGFGKGYAVDKMCEMLDEWDIQNYFIHGGHSSVFARGDMSGQIGWPVSISNPFHDHQPLYKYNLVNRGMSSSGLLKGSHIIDPRTGKPLTVTRAAWTFTQQASTGDALSTAFMIMTTDEINRYCAQHADVSAILLNLQDDKIQELHFGEKLNLLPPD